MRKPTFRLKTKARKLVSWMVGRTPRKERRISKATAARQLGISRMTVHRYTADKLVSVDSRGRVYLHEVAEVWSMVPQKRGAFSATRPTRASVTAILKAAIDARGWSRESYSPSTGAKRAARRAKIDSVLHPELAAFYEQSEAENKTSAE
jgi:hypothetical protein